MTDRPILFSAPMVRALLDGRKSMTRRLIKPTSQTDGFTMYPQYLNGERIGSSSDPSFYDLSQFAADPSKGLYGSGAPYCPGDRLWVRERLSVASNDQGARWLAYAADGKDVWPQTRWQKGRNSVPSIHMPRWASRLTLTVTEVRVQRLQDISEADAKAEGCSANAPIPGDPYPDWSQVYGAIDAYEHLWNSINAGRAPWDSNPWVCAITFKTALGNIDAISEAA